MKKTILILGTLLLAVVLIACGGKNKDIKHTVTFDYDNGASPTSTIVGNNEYVSKPDDDPVKNQYTFVFWTLDGTNEFKFLETKITKDITIKAKWEKVEEVPVNKYTITIKYNDNNTVDDQIEFTKSTKIETPEKPSKEGYRFLGWYVGNELFDFEKSVNKSIVIEAKWHKEPVEVSLGETYVHNVTTDETSSSGYFTIAGNLKSNPKSYTYNGLTLTKAMKFESSTVISFETMSDSAILKIIAYSDKNSSFSVPGHSAVDLTTEILEYNFTLGEAGIYTLKRVSQETLILYIEVTEKGNMPELSGDEVLVTINPNNNEKNISEIVGKNEVYSINRNFTNGLLKFDGWYTNKELTNKWSDNTIVTANLSLYAKWVEAVVYEVIADGKTYKVIEGMQVRLDDAKYILGKVFVEWWIGEEEVFDPSISINKNYELVPKYRDALSYTITYNLNDGLQENPVNSFYESQNIKLGTPTKDEHVFYGWYLDSELRTRFTKITNENLVVYAKWVYESEAIDFTKPVGYGELTVGGNIENKKVYTVTTGNEILQLLNDKRVATNKGKDLSKDYGLIIYINGKITLNNTNADEILLKEMGNNISLIGVGTNGEFDGIGIRVFSTNQVVIQNLKIHHVLNSTGEGDAISIIDSKYIWVDHCELFNEPLIGDPTKASASVKDKYDGLLDAKKESDFITYSWNYFHDSYKASLNGFSDSDEYKRKITYHHNYFENINSRLPLFRNGYGHVYNNYYKTIYTSAINSRMGAKILIENNIFEDVKNPIVSLDSSQVGYWNERGNVFENVTYGNVRKPDSEKIHHESDISTTDFEVEYQYIKHSTEGLKKIITDNVGVGIVN